MLVFKFFMCSDQNRFYNLVSAGQLDQLALLEQAGELKGPRIIYQYEQYTKYKIETGVGYQEDDVVILSFEMN
jgi:hypothetical protein